MKLARLNHILIPNLSSDRDRFRRGGFGKLARPTVWLYFALSEEGRFLLIFSLLAAFAGINTDLTQNSVLWAVVTAGLAASLLVRPIFRIRGVSVELCAPDRVIVDEPIHFEITLHNHGTTHWSSLRLQRPLLPWDGRWVGRRPVVRELGPGETKRVRVTARFAERGRHHLDMFSISSLVPGALAQGAPVTIEGPRFLVVPRPTEVEEWSVPIGTDRDGDESTPRLTQGDSSELLGVRPYRPGDRLRDLHALTWSRIGEPIVREYQAEPHANVGLLVDPTETRKDSPAFEALLALASGIVHRLTRDDRRVDFWILGKSGHYRALGDGRGRAEDALDLLALAPFEREPLSASQALAAIESAATELSGVQLLTTVEGEPQRKLVSHLRVHGLVVEAFHIGAKRNSSASMIGAEPLPLSIFSEPTPLRRQTLTSATRTSATGGGQR